MATIDQLTIDIDSSAKKAETTIDSLVDKLDILVKYLSKVTTTPVKINIDTSGFEKIEKAINISGIEKAAKSIQEKMSVATKAVENFEDKYKDLGKGFTLKGSTEYIQKQIDSLTNQLAKAKLAKEDFEKSGKTDLAGYETAVKNVIKLTNQIESLKSQLSDLQNIKPDMNFKINGLEESTKQISEVAEKIRTVSIPESAFNYNADAMKAVFGEMVAGIENWTQATQQFGANAGAVLNQTSTETEELNAKTKKFEESLRSLKIPPISTDNLDALKRQLEKAEAKLNELRANLENGITMGRVTENVGDSGYKKLREQIALTEKTAESLRDRIKEVGEASKNAIGINEVGKAANSASNSFSALAKSGSNASNPLKKVQSSLKGVLKALLPILGIRQLISFGKNSIQNSMEYLETLNYFDAAFGQVAANADLSSFEEMGYNSADAYYGSFAKRAEELTRKMSGFTIGKGGMLESTGAVSLGLDPSLLMNYQAMFGQMSSSMGVSSETSLKLSQALTELGADLASVKNLEFETVWNDMASGLAGMSRTLDKYGVNIRNVNLQQKLMELGIDANITALNQNDKALLRAIILLENTKYAWGDLADTINQPANQLRLIQANFENLSRTIGNLFLPLVKTVLPYVNALVIAVQRLFAWLGNLIGIDMSGISTAIGGADMGDILDQTDDLSTGLGDAKKQADKLNKSLRQFDELKVISTKQDEGTAGGAGGISGGLLDAAFEDAFSEYQKVWDEAFGNLENRAQELADKIEKAFEPIKKIIQDFAIGDFFQAGKDTSALVTGIFDFFADAIDKVDWSGIGQNIGNFIAGLDWIAILSSIGNLIWQAITAALETYSSIFSAAPIETAIISSIVVLKWSGLGKALYKSLKTALKTQFAIAIDKIGLALDGLLPKIIPYITQFLSALSPGMIGEIGIWIEKQLTGTIFDTNTWSGLPKAINDFLWEITYVIGDALEQIVIWIGTGIAEIFNRIFNFDTAISMFDAAGQWFSKISEDFANKDWLGIGKDIVMGILNGIGGVLYGIAEPFIDLFNWTWECICDVFGIHSPAKNMEPIGENIILGIVEGFKAFIGSFTAAVQEWWLESVVSWFTFERWSDLAQEIPKALSSKWNEFSLWWENSAIYKWWNENVAPWFAEDKWTFDGIKKGLSSAWESAIDSIKNVWNTFAKWLNDKLTWTIDPITIMGKTIFDGFTINLGKVPTFSTGGFPEDGLFYANHTELIGEFSNGRTAVVNNNQIISGIAEGIYPAMYNAVYAALQNNSNSGGDITIQVNLDGDVVYRNVVKRTEEQSGRTFGGRLVLADEVFR